MMLRRENSELFQPREEDDDDEEEIERSGSFDEDDQQPQSNTIRDRNLKEGLIRGSAIKSRMFVFLVGTLATMGVGPFDSSTSLMIDNVPAFLQCPANWDGAFNVRIATRGYEYEQTHAFFPLLPMIARFLSRAFILDWFTGNEVLAAASAAALFNNVLFVLSAILLFRLGCIVLGNEKLALRAALLFTWNPASIFFSVAYSESLFAFLAFLGMLILAKDVSFRSRFTATICFSLATLTRSNGSLLGVYSLWAAYRAFKANKSNHRVVIALLELAVIGGVHFASLLSVLGYGWAKFCYLIPNGAPRPTWCNDLVPNIYSHIEEKYWNLGLFNYYERRQIPNFILAAPAFTIAIKGLLAFMRDQDRSVPWPFLIQLAISIVTAALVMHVQVFTRLICASSPAFFWYAADLSMRKSVVSFFVHLYFAYYCMFGTAMFCAYFPWT